MFCSHSSIIIIIIMSNVAFVEKFATANNFQYMRCNEMERGRRYPILTIQLTSTKYGDFLLTTIEDPDDASKQYKVFLPRRYSNLFTTDELQAIQPHTLNLIYKGKRETMALLAIVGSKYKQLHFFCINGYNIFCLLISIFPLCVSDDVTADIN